MNDSKFVVTLNHNEAIELVTKLIRALAHNGYREPVTVDIDILDFDMEIDVRNGRHQKYEDTITAVIIERKEIES